MTASITDQLVDDLEQTLPIVSRAIEGRPLDAATLERVRSAWAEVCAGEHGQALLYAFRERAAAIVEPTERRAELRDRIVAAVDGLDDDATARLLSAWDTADPCALAAMRPNRFDAAPARTD